MIWYLSFFSQLVSKTLFKYFLFFYTKIGIDVTISLYRLMSILQSLKRRDDVLKYENKKDLAKKYASLLLKMVLILSAIAILLFLGLGIYVLLMDIQHNGFYFMK